MGMKQIRHVQSGSTIDREVATSRTDEETTNANKPSRMVARAGSARTVSGGAAYALAA